MFLRSKSGLRGPSSHNLVISSKTINCIAPKVPSCKTAAPKGQPIDVE